VLPGHSSGGAVLLCFDGSTGATRAVERAAELLGGGSAVVGYAWRPLMSGAFRHGPRLELTETLREAIAELDAAGGEHAAKIASEGAAAARRAGFGDVTTEIQPAPERVWSALLEIAERIDARLIVAGATGHCALPAVGIGSVARRLVNHADRPVLVVPPGPTP